MSVIHTLLHFWKQENAPHVFIIGLFFNLWPFSDIYFREQFLSIQATLHGNGYWLLPMCEKNHSLLNIAPILTNKVTFLAQDICPHDKSPLGTLELIYISYLGKFLANFAYF